MRLVLVQGDHAALQVDVAPREPPGLTLAHALALREEVDGAVVERDGVAAARRVALKQLPFLAREQGFLARGVCLRDLRQPAGGQRRELDLVGEHRQPQHTVDDLRDVAPRAPLQGRGELEHYPIGVGAREPRERNVADVRIPAVMKNARLVVRPEPELVGIALEGRARWMPAASPRATGRRGFPRRPRRRHSRRTSKERT